MNGPTRHCGLLLFALSAGFLPAAPGDAPDLVDPPDFVRFESFTLTDFSEDDAALYNFPVARPTPADADHVLLVPFSGQRKVWQYQLTAGQPNASLLSLQNHYEKQALAHGYTLEKTGASGDVSETFRRETLTRIAWVHVELDGSSVTLIQVEAPLAARLPAALAQADHRTLPPALSVGEQVLAQLQTDGRVILPLAFLPGRPDVDSEAAPLLREIARFLQAHPDLRLRVEGHTDALGDERDNRRLSEQRARTVCALLVSNGVARNRLNPVGRGGDDPVTEDTTLAGRERNRRIELIVSKS